MGPDYFFVVGGCPLYSKMLSTNLGLYPLDASSTSTPNIFVWKPKMPRDIAKYPGVGKGEDKTAPGLETMC